MGIKPILYPHHPSRWHTPTSMSPMMENIPMTSHFRWISYLIERYSRMCQGSRSRRNSLNMMTASYTAKACSSWVEWALYYLSIRKKWSCSCSVVNQGWSIIPNSTKSLLMRWIWAEHCMVAWETSWRQSMQKRLWGWWQRSKHLISTQHTIHLIW